MNRKKDLELLSEVYSEAMGYASGRGSVNTQPGAGGTGDYDDSTGQITQQAEDQNPLENDEGEEESPQERSARQLAQKGYTRKHADSKGNIIMHNGKSEAEIDTDGQINGQPASMFLRGTGEQEDIAADEDEGSADLIDHTGIEDDSVNSTRPQWTGENEEDDNAFPTDLSYFDSDEKDDEEPRVSGIRYFDPDTDHDSTLARHMKKVHGSDEDEGEREEKYRKRWGKDLDDQKERKGSSNAGEYTDVDKDEFCGPAGGAAPGTYPVNTRKRAIAAKSYAHNAPDPAGIDKCVAKKWPDLDEDEENSKKKGKYDDGDGKEERCDHVPCNKEHYISRHDRAYSMLAESYEKVYKR
mgnify:CR=1 FL=1|tara:strand:+ start:810 stop:1871 length:1062 start_codon:yes stop_codon:yes gene_type:complete